jgi:ribonucleoside-triphosphate reductase
MSEEALQTLRETARAGAVSMADELGLPRPKAVTTVKPSGTLSKIMDTTEGVHKPLGKYIFNNVNFSVHDPIVEKCKKAGYRVFPNPLDNTSVLITFPVAYENVRFTKSIVIRDGVDVEVEVNTESAVSQLYRYKLLMDNYVDHNCSVTISYSPDEVPQIIEWLLANWDAYVGVSFIYRNDPTKTAKDLGYLYLPQEVVTKADYDAYVSTLSPVDLDGTESFDELVQDGCATGACPIR